MQGSENEAVGRLTELIHSLMFEQDHEYIIQDYEQCGMAFLLQAACKIAVSCPM